MTVIAIRRQKGDLFTVITDEDTEIVINSATLEAAQDIAVGCETDEERLQELQLQSDYDRARVRSLELVARKEYCRAELVRRLSATYPSEATELAADEMERLGFLDDERYAQMYADAAYRLKKHGRRRVSYDLAQKGIERGLAEQIARELAPEPAQALDELLAGRIGADLESEAGCRRCIATLTRYGYEMGDIAAAMRRKVYADEE